MKNLKKFSALILSLLLILTAVFIPATITASAATELNPQESIIYGLLPTSTHIASGKAYNYGWDQTGAPSGSPLDYAFKYLTDGNTAVRYDHSGGNGTYLVWDFPSTYNVTDVALWNYNNNDYETSYDVYIVDDVDAALLTEGNRVVSYTAKGSNATKYQAYSDISKTGNYVVLHITKAAYNGNTSTRLFEFAVYGNPAESDCNCAYHENKSYGHSEIALKHNDSLLKGLTPTISTSAKNPERLNNGYVTTEKASDNYGAELGALNGCNITYALDTLYDIKSFSVNIGRFYSYKTSYSVYVGNDLNTLYSGSPVYTYSYNSEDIFDMGVGQEIRFNGTYPQGKYIGFHVNADDHPYGSAYVSEIQVFGSKASGRFEKWVTSSSTEVTDTYLANNLIKDKTWVYGGQDNNTAGSTWSWDQTSVTTYLSKNILVDGTLTGNHADVQNNKNAKLIWHLDKNTKINGFLLFNHKTATYETAYEVYAAESLSGLFNAENKIYEYKIRDEDGNLIENRNKIGGSFVEFYGNAVKNANYVAVWIREGYTIANGSENTGVRISEIAFFGEEVAANDDVYITMPTGSTRTDIASFERVAEELDNNFTYEKSLLKSEKLTIKNASGTVITNSLSPHLTDGVESINEMSGNREYRGNSHEYLTYYLGAPTEVTGFAHFRSNANSTSLYKVYVGYSSETLFNAENLVLDMSDVTSTTHIDAYATKFAVAKKGLYLGVEYVNVMGSSSNASYSQVTRIGEIAAWGTQEDLGYELTPSIPATTNVAGTSEYDNLLKGLVAETGYYGSVHANGTNWLNGITDGIANLHYDMNYTSESAASASELFYDLGYTATVHEFAYWMTCAGHQFSYQVYMSDSLDTLYKEPVLVWDYKISPDSVGQKFVLDEPMQVRYVAIRMGDTRVARDSFRTSEIALFGTRDNTQIEGESFATIERVDVEAVDNPTYITYTNTFNFPAGQLDGVAKIEEIGTLVYPTTALGNTALTLEFASAAKAKSDEKALAEITEYDEAGYTAVKAQSTFRGLENVGDTTKLTAVSYVTVNYGDNTVTYYSDPMVYSKTQMKRLAAKEQINTYGLLSTDEIIKPVEGKTPWNCAIAEVWSYAMKAMNLLKTNKTEPIKNAGAWLTDVKTQYSIEQEWLDNGLVTMGDTSRISAVIRKLMKGEGVTVVGLGGSITEGYFSGNGSEQSRRVADFLNAAYPGKVTYVNAGIAATGAVMGAYRLNADVLSHNPDLVIIEYAVNDDRGDETAMAAYENIVRTLLSKDVAVLALHNITFADNDNVNTRRMNASGSAKLHENIGKLYSLPQVSAVDAFFDTDIYAKGDNTTLYYYGTAENPKDGTHPNEKGHAASGALMANLIYTVMCNLEKLPTESAAIPTYPSQPQGNFIDADKAVIVKSQEVNDDGDARVAIEGATYTEKTLAVGKDSTRVNNTYTGYYTVAAGTTATLTLTNVSDAFLVVLENANGDKDAQVVTKDADGNVILENTLDAYYNGALSVDAARIINSDERVYHGETATVTVEVTATDASVYIGGVMGCFN